MTAKELAVKKLGEAVKIPYPLSGEKIGYVCGYHEGMNRIILGLHSKHGWRFEQSSHSDELMVKVYKSFIYVEIEDVL